VGVMTLSVVLSVMNGFDEDLKSKIVGLNAHIVITGYQSDFVSRHDEVVNLVKGIPRVKSVGPYVEGQSLARSKSRSLGIMVWGVDPDRPQAVADLDAYLNHGVKSDALRGPGSEGQARAERIFLGHELARRLGVGRGDDLILFLPILQQTPMGLMPQSMRFQVVGIFQTGMYDYDATFSYVSLKNAQRMYQMPDGVTGVAVKVDDVNQAPMVAKRIREVLQGRYQVQDWLQMNRNLFIALQTEKMVMGIILSLIVLVAALNIINPLTMMVIEKTKEIGILKAMGARNSSVKDIFVFQGMFIGTMGTLLGMALGFVLCQIIEQIPIPMPGGGSVYYIDRLPVKVDVFVSYVVIPVCSMLLCWVSTLYPARQAAKMEPVDAIRYD